MKPQVVIYGLDSSEVNTSFVKKIANINGTFELVFTPNLLGLDLINWIKENTTLVKEFVFSIDAIAYYDLKGSRYYEDIQAADDRLYSTFEALREAFPNIPVTAFNSILRLAPNINNEKDRANHNLIREYYINKDKIDNAVVIGEERTQLINRNIEIENTINSEVFYNWQRTIERNLTINKRMLSWTDLGYIKKLVFFADNSNQYGATSLNRKYLEKKVEQLPSTLGGKVHFIAGEYGVSSLLIGGLEYIYSNTKIELNTVFTNPDVEKEWIDYNETFSLYQSIKNHAGVMGIKTDYFPDTGSSVLVFAHTPYSNDDELIRLIKENVNRAIVIVPSQSTGFISRLRKEVDVHKLLAFCGVGNPSEQIGQAFGQGIARYTALKTSAANEESIKNHVDLLLKAFYDVSYRKQLLNTTTDFITSKGTDIYHIYYIQEEVNKFLDKIMRPRVLGIYASKFHNKNVNGLSNYYVADSKFAKMDLDNILDANMDTNLSIISGTPTITEFMDIPSTHWVYPHAMKLRSLKLFNGDNLHPDNTMMRFELAVLLYNLYKFDVNMAYVPNPMFEDIPTTHILYKQIATLKYLGIMDGISETKFGLYEDLDRITVANILVKSLALDITLKKDVIPTYFVDIPAASPANLLAHVGIVSVPADKLFNPNGKATNAMVATMISKSLELL